MRFQLFHHRASTRIAGIAALVGVAGVTAAIMQFGSTEPLAPLASTAYAATDNREMPIHLTTLVPDGGEKCAAGAPLDITWDGTRFQGRVKLSLWNGRRSEWTVLAADLPGNAGHYLWNVPRDLRGDMFRVKVESHTMSGVQRISETYFSVDEYARLSSAGSNTVASTGYAVKVFPNPTAGNLRVEWGAHTAKHITIHDLGGKEVKAFDNLAGSSLNIPSTGLENGTYMVSVEFNDGARASQKVIIHQ